MAFETEKQARSIAEHREQIQKEKAEAPKSVNATEIINSQYNLLFHYYTGRDITMNLKKISDECIALYCVACKKFSKGVPLEDIGQYINQSEKFKDFNSDLDFFKSLNKA